MEIVIAGLMYLGIIASGEFDQPTGDQSGNDTERIVDMDDSIDD